jgi:hypothetical protein
MREGGWWPMCFGWNLVVFKWKKSFFDLKCAGQFSLLFLVASGSENPRFPSFGCCSDFSFAGSPVGFGFATVLCSFLDLTVSPEQKICVLLAASTRSGFVPGFVSWSSFPIDFDYGFSVSLSSRSRHSFRSGVEDFLLPAWSVPFPARESSSAQCSLVKASVSLAQICRRGQSTSLLEIFWSLSIYPVRSLASVPCSSSYRQLRLGSAVNRQRPGLWYPLKFSVFARSSFSGVSSFVPLLVSFVASAKFPACSFLGHEFGSRLLLVAPDRTDCYLLALLDVFFEFHFHNSFKIWFFSCYRFTTMVDKTGENCSVFMVYHKTALAWFWKPIDFL